jgi:hypothetical protein
MQCGYTGSPESVCGSGSGSGQYGPDEPSYGTFFTVLYSSVIKRELQRRPKEVG